MAKQAAAVALGAVVFLFAVWLFLLGLPRNITGSIGYQP